MPDTAIRVEAVSKRYRIGERQTYKTLRESITKSFSAPFRWLRSPGVDTPQQHIWALKDVSFEVKAGEVVAIVGANGSGKSTLLKILSRVVRPTLGQTTVYGRLGALLEVGT